MTRLFIAAWPPSDLAERWLDLLASIRSSCGDEPGVRPVPKPNLHATLRFLGEVDPTDVAARLTGLRLPSAVARLGPEVSRLGPRQLVIPVAGLDDLARAVRAATDDLGERPDHDFVGHMTVARTKPDASSALEGTPFEGEFEVGAIGLVESRLEPTGAVYSTLRCFPLG